MRTTGLFLIVCLAAPAASSASFDLDRPVLKIPDTHNTAPYLRQVEHDPAGFSADLAPADPAHTRDMLISVSPRPGETVRSVEVFITDKDAGSFSHFAAERQGSGFYRFPLDESLAGQLRFEIVCDTDRGLVRISRDRAMPGSAEDTAAAEDTGYTITLKVFPKQPYTEHVTTFVYEIAYRGKPVTDLAPIGGHDLVLAAWNRSWFGSLEEFLFAYSTQDLGGPEAAASLVFHKPGKYAVFGQFKHRGTVHTVDSTIRVDLEPRSPKINTDYESSY